MGVWFQNDIFVAMFKLRCTGKSSVEKLNLIVCGNWVTFWLILENNILVAVACNVEAFYSPEPDPVLAVPLPVLPLTATYHQIITKPHC